MIVLNAYYEFENETSIRRHYYKSFFERIIQKDDVYDFNYDDLDVEAYIDIASKFGFDVNHEVSEIVWGAIGDKTSEYIDLTLIRLVLEYIAEKKLVCYSVGLCPDDSITFEAKDLFCYSDSGFLYCILKSSGDKDRDKAKAERSAAYLAEFYNDITVYKDATKIEKHIDNYTWVYDSSPTDN